MVSSTMNRSPYTNVTAIFGWSLAIAALHSNSAIAAPAQSEGAAPIDESTDEPTAEPDDASGPLRVTVDPGIEDAQLMPGWLMTRNPHIGQAIELEGHEQWIEVEIGGSTYDYEFSVRAMRDGKVVGDSVEIHRCDCNYSSLAEMIDAEIAEAIERLETLEAPVQAASSESDASRESASISVQAPSPEIRRGVGKLGIAGIYTGAIGAIGVVTGGLFIGTGVRETNAYANVYHRNFLTPGYAILSLGIATFTAGATMLGLDLTRCKRKPELRRCSSPEGPTHSARGARRRGISAVVTREMTGLVVVGKF